jgi:dihydroorotase
MCHAPAQCFNIAERGYLREGYFADMVLVDLQQTTQVTKDQILYKCGWSPLEGKTFPAAICYTLVNGQIVYESGKLNENAPRGMRLSFDR